jgi:hypothetical protein
MPPEDVALRPLSSVFFVARVVDGDNALPKTSERVASAMGSRRTKVG